jgi:hypothetical protein
MKLPFSVVSIFCLSLMGGAVSAQKSSDAETTVTAKLAITPLLPSGSKFAEIKRKSDNGFITLPSILLKDVTGDTIAECVVAYYAKSDEEAQQQDFFRRAHVAVFSKDQGQWSHLWTSDGWGLAFSQIGNTEFDSFVFSAQDLNNDALNEITALRVSHGAEGRVSDVWRWNGTTFANVLHLQLPTRIEKTEKGQVKLISEERRYGAYCKYESTWNAETKQYDSKLIESYEPPLKPAEAK